MKGKNLVLFGIVAILLCGCGRVSKEEYDKVVEENERIKTENELLVREMDLVEKASGYKATIEAQYNHLMFIIYVSELISNEELNSIKGTVKTRYEQSTAAIDAVLSMCESVSDISDGLVDTYDETEKTIEDIYDSWNDETEKIFVLEEMMRGN